MKIFKSRLFVKKTFQFTWFKCHILVITVIKRIQSNQCRIHVAILIYYFDREALSFCFQFTSRIFHINNIRAIIYLFGLSYFYITINHFYFITRKLKHQFWVILLWNYIYMNTLKIKYVLYIRARIYLYKKI